MMLLDLDEGRRRVFFRPRRDFLYSHTFIFSKTHEDIIILLFGKGSPLYKTLCFPTSIVFVFLFPWLGALALPLAVTRLDISRMGCATSFTRKRVSDKGPHVFPWNGHVSALPCLPVLCELCSSKDFGVLSPCGAQLYWNVLFDTLQTLGR
jgi:hypothetical protein